MKDTFFVWRSLVPACFLGAGACVFVGVLVSFRMSESAFAGAAEVVRQLSFEGTEFFGALKKAILRDLIFCVLAVLLSSGLAAAVLLGAVVGAKSFFAGAAAGLAAKCLVFGDAARVCSVVFASNFLVLPLYVLLFVSSISFIARLSTLAPAARAKEYGGFLARVTVFFTLMCLAQLVQTAIGICVINIGR